MPDHATVQKKPLSMYATVMGGSESELGKKEIHEDRKEFAKQRKKEGC